MHTPATLLEVAAQRTARMIVGRAIRAELHVIIGEIEGVVTAPNSVDLVCLDFVKAVRAKGAVR